MNTFTFFDTIYNNAKENAVIIMSDDGVILKINKAFEMAFDYTEEDLAGKNFRLLFNERDQKTRKPERELETVKCEGAASDDNYLVHKDGTQIWITGESILVKSNNEETYIVKIFHDIHAQKQLERFLLESNEFIESIFDSIKETALMIIDSTMRIVKVNKTFIELFEITVPVIEGTRLSELGNSFWQKADVKKLLRDVIVTNKAIKDEHFEFETKSGIKKKINFHSKLINGYSDTEKKILILLKFE
ncbi:MAG: PAS domain-containing protein [Chitinophagaceae bacterium]